MANKKKSTKKEEPTSDGFYKSYNMRWLKEVKDEHPDGYIVDEYEAEYGEIK